MKARKNVSVVSALMAAFCTLLAGRLNGQTASYLSTLTNLHSFMGSNDGGYTIGGLVMSGNTLYGVASDGGTNSSGTVFAVNTDGSGFTNLHTFLPLLSQYPPNYNYPGTNIDGGTPESTLVLSGNTLYGTTAAGGIFPHSGNDFGSGTIFKINTDGSGFTTLHYFNSFTNDGYLDAQTTGKAGLILVGNTLYGTASGGGSNGFGTIYAINTDGSDYTNLYSFTLGNYENPPTSLIFSSNKFYGATARSIFSINLDGSDFTTISTNGSGILALSGSTLFGGVVGLNYSVNTIFSVHTDGTGFTNLYTVQPLDYDTEGNNVTAITCVSNSLIGVCEWGGPGYLYNDSSTGNGTVFMMNINGTGFRIISTLPTNGYVGAYPYGAPLVVGNTLYGTTSYGSTNAGSVYSVAFTNPTVPVPSSPTGARFFRITGPAATSITSFRGDGSIIWNNAQPGATYTVQSSTSLAGGNWVDFVNLPTTGSTHTNKLLDFHTPAGMVFIPGGSFMMGDNLDGETDAVPVLTTVSAFYMDSTKVTGNMFTPVLYWATNNGYSFYEFGALGNGPFTVAWAEAVKWCNARSQMAGLNPVYFTDTNLTQLFTNGYNTTPVYANWSANGYRLPTEAEWEKAARSGLNGQRFPWGNFSSQSLANYYGDTPADFAFDLGPDGANQLGGKYGGPVAEGSFPPNSYGLYDMAGNGFEYIWDRYAPYYAGGIDPHGPLTGFNIVRAGDYAFGNGSRYCKCAYRRVHSSWYTEDAVDFLCFRTVRNAR